MMENSEFLMPCDRCAATSSLGASACRSAANGKVPLRSQEEQHQITSTNDAHIHTEVNRAHRSTQ